MNSWRQSDPIGAAAPAGGNDAADEGAASADAVSPPADDHAAVIRSEAADAANDPIALARLYGEPLFALPDDLYIPPDALEVFLDAFEGPLDLLLYLIRRQNFNILDIPMATLTRQYLSYVDEVRARNLELSAEYLLMAALLIEIKSRLLLPAKKSTDDQESVEDPRAELARRLIEYEQMKLAAAKLGALPQHGRDFWCAHVATGGSVVRRFPKVVPDDLQRAWNDIVARARLVQHHRITREALSVREHMSVVLRKLQGRRFALFEDLFEPARGVPVVIVTFIALLELARESLVEITQAEAFAPIYVRMGFTAA